MPTVLRVGGARVVIYPNDHRPAHVHVMRGDCEAVFDLNCSNGPPHLRERFGCTRAELRRIEIVLSDDLKLLCAVWRHIHEAG